MGVCWGHGWGWVFAGGVAGDGFLLGAWLGLVWWDDGLIRMRFICG